MFINHKFILLAIKFITLIIQLQIIIFIIILMFTLNIPRYFIHFLIFLLIIINFSFSHLISFI